MPALHRHLPAVSPVLLACLCAGCITIKNFQDAPPAQLDPAPPKPIINALPPMNEGRATRDAGRVSGAAGRVTSGGAEKSTVGRVTSDNRRETRDTPRSTTSSASNPLADQIMGRTPPPAPPQSFPSLGKTNAPAFQSLERPARVTSAEGRGSSGGTVTGVVGRGTSENRIATRDTRHETRDTPPPADTRPSPPDPRHSSSPPSPLDTRLLALNFRQIIALQTLLDRQNFSCNCADGKVGSRTHAALRAFQKAHNLAITGEPNAATLAALGDLGSAFTSYTITVEDHAQLTQNPTSWVARAQAARLGYQTILEAVAERGHATQQAIRDLNPQVAVWPDPPAGTTLTVPDVSGGEKPGQAARIRISIGGKLIRVFDGAGGQLAQFPCSIARDPAKREPCEISVAVVAPNPNYTYDPALFAEDPESKSITTKLIIPPGPRNPVGSAWVGLSKTGYGMHGTPKPEDIGKTESHGCFRLANWNAQKLLRMVEIGTPVIVEE